MRNEKNEIAIIAITDAIKLGININFHLFTKTFKISCKLISCSSI